MRESRYVSLGLLTLTTLITKIIQITPTTLRTLITLTTLISSIALNTLKHEARSGGLCPYRSCCLICRLSLSRSLRLCLSSFLQDVGLPLSLGLCLCRLSCLNVANKVVTIADKQELM